jgi:Chaperone of endosialidase
MNPSIQFKTIVPPARNSISRSPLRRAFLLIPLVFVCFALAPTARAVSPFPDGGYAGGTTAKGDFALQNLTTGNQNTAIGASALAFTTTGSNNTATGAFALNSNTADNNTATGSQALGDNTTGTDNTAIGEAALFNNGGNNNIGLGVNAGSNLTTGDNNIDIGNQGLAAEANTIRISTQGTQKATFIAGIIGAPVSGATVHISGSGQLGIGPPSSVRFKDDIKPMDRASEAILALKPVTFRYKKGLDPERIPQFGLVAEEVEKVNPDLVARDDQGRVYTVRYEAVNAMLLNEFLKEHRKVQEQERRSDLQDRQVQELEATVANQQKQIEALTTGLQKVSDQLETNKTATQIVVSDQ